MSPQIGGPPASTFVNDPHRHLVTEAQQATQNFVPPQNTSLPSEVNDDDSTVREVFDSYNMAASGETEIEDDGSRRMFVSPLPRHELQHENDEHENEDDDEDEDDDSSSSSYSDDEDEKNAYTKSRTRRNSNKIRNRDKKKNQNRSRSRARHTERDSRTGTATAKYPFVDVDESVKSSKSKSTVTEDIRLAVFVVALYVLTSLVPVDRAFTTIPFLKWADHVPYSSLTVKSLLAGIVMFITLRLVL
jgi:hypothetical protein